MVLISNRNNISNERPCSTAAETAPGISELFALMSCILFGELCMKFSEPTRREKRRTWKRIVLFGVQCSGCFMNLFLFPLLSTNSRLIIATLSLSWSCYGHPLLQSPHLRHLQPIRHSRFTLEADCPWFPCPADPCLKCFHLTPPPLCESTTNTPCSTWKATRFLLLVCWNHITFQKQSKEKIMWCVAPWYTYRLNACQTHSPMMCTSRPITPYRS